MAKQKNTDTDKPFHVVTIPAGWFCGGHNDKGQAEVDCIARTARAVDLEITTRYKVIDKPTTKK